jgi:predicted NodU family carbamoyl transferase
MTGVPFLQNTSFDESESVACQSEEALDCFFSTKIDELLLNDFAIERHTVE